MSTKPFPTRLFVFVFLGWTFDFYDLVLFGFLREPIARALSLSHATEPWILGVALGTSGIGGLVSGALADRFSKKDVLAVTILLYSVGSLISGLAPNVYVFFAGRALVGLGVGGEWAIGHGMLAEAVDAKVRGRAAAALQSGEPVGVAIAVVMGFLVMPIIGWRAVMIASSVTALLAFAARRSIPFTEQKRAKVTLDDVRRANVGTRLVTAWILGVLKLGTYWTCYTWLPSFLLNQMKQGVGKSAAWVLTAQIGQLAGMNVFGAVSDRVGRRPAFAAFSVLTAIALAMLAFEWSWLSPRPLLFWSVMLLLGFGSGCTAGFGALLAELFPGEIRGATMGATYNLARTAQLGAPVLVAWAVDSYGLSGGLSVPLVLALATASWVWVLPETRGIPLPRFRDTTQA